MPDSCIIRHIVNYQYDDPYGNPYDYHYRSESHEPAQTTIATAMGMCTTRAASVTMTAAVHAFTPTPRNHRKYPTGPVSGD
jgi:hypothetical protein